MSTASLIQRATDMLNHPRSSPIDRAAAERFLKRITKRLAKAVAETGGYNPYERSYGSKYIHDRYVPLTELAAMMRADIKLARKLGQQAAKVASTPGAIEIPDPIGHAPKDIKFSVRTQYYSGGGAIDITVRNIPRDWGFTTQTDRWGYERKMPTQALKDLADALREIHRAYNHDGSDVQTDYFDVNFYGGISDENGLML